VKISDALNSYFQRKYKSGMDIISSKVKNISFKRQEEVKPNTIA
jgi:hypothetical protein